MSKKTKKIIVNGLTISRIIGALLMPLLFKYDNIALLLSFLTILLVTDFFDGKLSRRWKVQTIGGKILDPIGDKLLAISCIFIMISKFQYFLIILILEFLIIIINTIRVLRSDIVNSSYIGKIKTWFLSITLIMGVINYFNFDIINLILGLFKVSTNFVIKEEWILASSVITIISEILTLLSYLKQAHDNPKSEKFKDKKMRKLKDIFRIIFDETRFDKDKDKPLIDIITF